MSADNQKRVHTWLAIGTTAIASFQVLVWVTSLLAVVITAVAIPFLFSTKLSSVLATVVVLAISLSAGAVVAFLVGRLVHRLSPDVIPNP